MATNNGQFEPDSSSEFSDETIRRFLLGALSAAEQPAFEQQLLIDDSLAARVQLAELELADDYAYERLSGAEQDQLKENFLLSTGRVRKISVSKSLRDQFAPLPEARTKSLADTYRERLWSIFSLRRTAWRVAFAAVIFVLLVGTVWVAVRKEERIKEAITRPFRRRRAPVPVVPELSNHPTNNSTPDHQPVSSPMPVHEQKPSTARGIISLTPDGSPEGSVIPSVSVPKGEQDILRLQLVLKTNEPGTYRAELLTADGQSVFSAESIKPAENGGSQIDFDAPAHLLKSGSYQIKLNRDQSGATVSAGSYYFRVQ